MINTVSEHTDLLYSTNIKKKKFISCICLILLLKFLNSFTIQMILILGGMIDKVSAAIVK